MSMEAPSFDPARIDRFGFDPEAIEDRIARLEADPPEDSQAVMGSQISREVDRDDSTYRELSMEERRFLEWKV